MEDFRRAQQRLGRDATPVQADAAEVRALDDRGPESELRRTDGSDVAAGAGADDDDVKTGVSHGACLTAPLTSAGPTPISRNRRSGRRRWRRRARTAPR